MSKKVLTKAVVVNHLNESIGLSKRECQYFFESFVDIITSQLKTHKDVKIVNFGIFKVKNKSIQTLSYIGFEKKYLRKYFEKNACTSYDRIVPVGTVLDMDLNWDGYTMPYELSRVVDIK